MGSESENHRPLQHKHQVQGGDTRGCQRLTDHLRGTFPGGWGPPRAAERRGQGVAGCGGEHGAGRGSDTDTQTRGHLAPAPAARTAGPVGGRLGARLRPEPL